MHKMSYDCYNIAGTYAIFYSSAIFNLLLQRAQLGCRIHDNNSYYSLTLFLYSFPYHSLFNSLSFIVHYFIDYYSRDHNYYMVVILER